MTTYPKRPTGHVTEDRAIQIFISKCDPEWIITPVVKDYGLDLRVEISRNGAVSGEEFFVQVKGRSRIDPDREYPPKAHVRQATVNYWLGKLSPTLVAVVDVAQGDVFFDWLEYSYPDYPRTRDADGEIQLPLSKNSARHGLRETVLPYICHYYAAIRKDVQGVSHSWYLTRVLFHVAALFRICAKMAIEYQRLDTDDPDDLRRLFGYFYTEFAAHDELLLALREGHFGGLPDTASRLFALVGSRLSLYDKTKEKFFRRENSDPISGHWLIRPNYQGVREHLLSTLDVLQAIEEILFQAVALGRLIWVPENSAGEPQDA